MIALDEALAIIAGAATRLGSEHVSLNVAANRILAEPIVAAFENPRANVSMMDGYAVHSDDTRAGGEFDVIGISAAGKRFGGSIGPGQAARIFTGAALPDGADRVVIQENVVVDSERMTIVDETGPIFVRSKGSDFAVGEIVVAAGTLLSPSALVAAAGAGAGMVAVARRPRVVTIATGDELRPAGTAIDDPDHIIDSIAPGLHAMLRAMGAEVVGHVLLGDDLPALESAAADAVARADLVVVTGGASVGARDHAKAMFAPLGMDLLFSKVAIKPGKPVWLGRVGETLVMGLPGNPGSALVTARLLLAPLVAGLLGQTSPPPLQWVDLPLGEPIPATSDRETFLRATLKIGKLFPVTNQDSGAQRALGEATWLIRCPAEQDALPAGTTVCAIAL